MTAESYIEDRQATTQYLTFKVDWVLIALIGLSLQAFWFWRLNQPTYMDAFYYTTNGQRLASGHGFTELIIWQYLDDPAGLPAASHTYWMPLPSMMAAAGYLLRNDFKGAQLLFWLLAGLLPLLAYAISWLLSRQRWQAWVAAAFAAVGGYYAPFFGQPTTFAPFAWAGGLCLLALGLAAMDGKAAKDPLAPILMTAKRQRFWWLAAGLTAGLAHLTRADGILLLAIGFVIWALAARQRVIRKGHSIASHSSTPDTQIFSGLILLILGYMVIMGWWFLRNWIVLGRPLSTAGSQSIFLTTYDDLFAYGRLNDLQTFLAWGWQNILRSRLQGIWLVLQSFVAIPGLIFLTPFIVASFASFLRRPAGRQLLKPVGAFALALFASSALIFTFPGMRGSFFHSSIALWPWTTALAAAGIGLAVDWAAARLAHWKPERAKRIFSALFILLAIILTLFISQFRLSPLEDPVIYRQIGSMIPPSSVVMVGNAPALHYFTGLPAVSVPNEPAATLLQAADRYGVTHLVLDENHPRPLDDLYLGLAQDPRIKIIWAAEDVKLYELADGSD